MPPCREPEIWISTDLNLIEWELLFQMKLKETVSLKVHATRVWSYGEFAFCDYHNKGQGKNCLLLAGVDVGAGVLTFGSI